MLLLDCLVDMNRCICLTGNKLLYPLRHEATRAASPQKDRKQKHTVCISPVSVRIHAACCQPALFSRKKQRQIKTLKTESRPGHRPRPRKTAAAIKTEVVGHTMETPYELVMIQIILFAPDTDNLFFFLADSKASLPNTTNFSIFPR